MSGQIFISYRRDDTAYPAGRLYDRLSAHFPLNQIFIDVDSIDPGEDFVKMIKKTVGSCDVLIAVIGKGWLTSCDQEGQRRLDNPEDFVRIEIGAALERNIRVIPVLVEGASMPRRGDLPDDIKSLLSRNALEVSHTRFRADSERLIGALERALEIARAEYQRKREEKERLDAEQRERDEKERLEAGHRQRAEKDRLEAERSEREEKERLETERDETEAKESLEAECRQKEQQEKERLEAEQRERERPEAERRQREEQDRLEHEPQAQPLSPVAPVAPSTPPAKPKADTPSAETLKVVYPVAPKPAEPERDKPPPPSSGGTGGKSPSKQVSPPPLPPPPLPPVEHQSQIVAHFFFRQRTHAAAGSVSIWLDGSLVQKTPLNLGINAAAPSTIGEHIVEVKLKCLGVCFNEKFYFKLLESGEYWIDLDQNPVTTRLTCEVQKITPKN
jgi:TIR domain